MWTLVWAVGKWLVKSYVKILLWAILHPLPAIAIGAGLALASSWLETQPWAGAQVLAWVTGAMGTSLIVTGIGAFLGGKIIGTHITIAKYVGATTSWWWYVQRASKGYLPFP